MSYESPEVLDLGAVEELTFGGELWPSLDRWTGYRGWLQVAPEEEEQ